MLRSFVDESGAELFGDLVDVEALEELANGGRADVGEERIIAFVLGLLAKMEDSSSVSSELASIGRPGLSGIDMFSGTDSCLPASMTT